jgi:hypothetical protein
MTTKIARLLTTLGCGVLVAGCEASTQIKSAKDPAFRDHVAKLFVISEVGAEYDSQYRNDEPTRTSTTGTSHVTLAAQFKAALVREAEACHIQLDVSSVSKLDLDPKAHLARMEGFGARYVLTLAETGGTKGADGTVLEAAYDARLTDREVEYRMVWRADMHLRHGSGFGTEDPGVVAARDLLMKLEADQVIAPCPGLRQRKLDQDREDEARRRGRR